MKMGSLLVSLAYHSNFLSPLDVLPFSNENLFKPPVKGHQSMSMCQGENPPLSCIPPIGSDQSVKRGDDWRLCAGRNIDSYVKLPGLAPGRNPATKRGPDEAFDWMLTG